MSHWSAEEAQRSWADLQRQIADEVSRVMDTVGERSTLHVQLAGLLMLLSYVERAHQSCVVNAQADLDALYTGMQKLLEVSEELNRRRSVVRVFADDVERLLGPRHPEESPEEHAIRNTILDIKKSYL